MTCPTILAGRGFALIDVNIAPLTAESRWTRAQKEDRRGALRACRTVGARRGSAFIHISLTLLASKSWVTYTDEGVHLITLSTHPAISTWRRGTLVNIGLAKSTEEPRRA